MDWWSRDSLTESCGVGRREGALEEVVVVGLAEVGFERRSIRAGFGVPLSQGRKFEVQRLSQREGWVVGAWSWKFVRRRSLAEG